MGLDGWQQYDPGSAGELHCVSVTTGFCGSFGVYGTQGAIAPGNMPGSRMGAATWTDKNGNLWLFGGWGYDDGTAQNANSHGFGDLNDFWEYQPSAEQRV